MSKPFRFAAVSTAAIVLFVAMAAPGHAAVIPGWYSTTDLSAVVSEGNSDTINVGATLNIRAHVAAHELDNRGLLHAQRRPGAPAVRGVINGPTRFRRKGRLVAKSEKIFGNTNFERRVTERFFWNLGATGERDKFAGLNSRLRAWPA